MLIVDRIEEGLVICEEGDIIFELPLEMISGEVHEGDALLPMEDGRYTADKAATQQRRSRMAARFSRLRKKK